MNISASIEKAKSEGNAESLIALREKISLATATMYELEQIPGVSDSLASEILMKRNLIIQKACLSEERHQYSALELAHGIGPKKAKSLDEFIGTCSKATSAAKS